MVDSFNIEPPIATDFEGRKLPVLQQPIDGRTMYVQIIGKLVHVEYFRIIRHPLSLQKIIPAFNLNLFLAHSIKAIDSLCTQS